MVVDEPIVKFIKKHHVLTLATHLDALSEALEVEISCLKASRMLDIDGVTTATTPASLDYSTIGYRVYWSSRRCCVVDAKVWSIDTVNRVKTLVCKLRADACVFQWGLEHLLLERCTVGIPVGYAAILVDVRDGINGLIATCEACAIDATDAH